VQGRVLGVLSRTGSELTMRGVASLAGTSVQQTSVVLAHLVSLGMVTRREAGTAALVGLERSNAAVVAVLALARLHNAVLGLLREEAHNISPAPASLVLFGSFARGEARPESDLDVLAVRPAGVMVDDDGWTDALGRWRAAAQRVAGNPVDLLELSIADLGNLSTKSPLWQNIADEGIVLVGARLHVQGHRLVLAQDRFSAVVSPG